jgi:hypothetical protein
MTVGNGLSSDAINQLLTNYTVQLRNLMTNVQNLSLNINGQDAGLAFLEAAGYDSDDAQSALLAIAYLNTIAGCYFGLVQQGGSGGTGAALFDFNNELSQYWAGQ